jgi:hypothetical protein
MKGHITGSLGGGTSVKCSEGTSKWKFNFQMQTTIEVNADFTANCRVASQTNGDKGKIEGSGDSVLWSQTCELLPMHSPPTTLTLTAYLFTWTTMWFPMLTDCLTDTLTDAVPCLLILSGLSQHPYCMPSDPYLSCLLILAMTHAPMGCTIYSGLTVTCTGRPDLVTFRFNLQSASSFIVNHLCDSLISHSFTFPSFLT